MWKHKRPQVANAILRKKNRAEEIKFLDFRLCYKIRVIRTVHHWHNNELRSMGQNRKPRNEPTHV